MNSQYQVSQCRSIAPFYHRVWPPHRGERWHPFPEGSEGSSTHRKRDSGRASQTGPFHTSSNAVEARRGGVGPRVLARKRPKCLFLQRFAVDRAFLQPSRSVSRFWKSQPRGQRQHESVKHGGSEGSHREPVSHPRLAASTGAVRAPARERLFAPRVWPLPRGQ